MKYLSKNRHFGLSKKRELIKEIGLFLADILYNAVIIIALVVLIRTFLISPFRVIGSSMADTLQNNEFILIDKLSYHLGEPRRGDPIVFLPPITNKYPHKFEESVTTNAEGEGSLAISDLITSKKTFYCQNKWMTFFWFCQDKVEEKDIVYFRPMTNEITDGPINTDWKNAFKQSVSKEEIKHENVTIKGGPNQTYFVRIYSSAGPEYFVKRIIGIPGDTIKIENGRVYLKEKNANGFTELNETYLNQNNALSTYVKRDMESSEFTVPEGHYFVLGDNRNHSNDSRHWFSPVDEIQSPYVNYENISGKVLIVLWPPNELRILDAGVLEKK